jgi:4-hydroxybenzoate polyprenyltransferase/phosphoserine phosphatase
VPVLWFYYKIPYASRPIWHQHLGREWDDLAAWLGSSIDRDSPKLVWRKRSNFQQKAHEMNHGNKDPAVCDSTAAEHTGHGVAALPLCFDLDGSLVNTDTLVEALIRAAHDWSVMRRLPALFESGKAGLKAGLADLVTVDPAILPYNEAALSYLRDEKAAGRYLVLATAANRRIADDVNRYLGGLFDEVIASDERNNVKGAVKAKVLTARFGEKGFSYAGNDRSDLPVWKHAGAAVLVNLSEAVARDAAQCAPVEKVIGISRGVLVPLLKQMRLYQWSKNVLVFVPILASGAILDMKAWLAALLAFFAFCLVASSLYAVNDLMDIESDRSHARKRLRPFASGELSPATGLAAIPVLLLAGFALGLWAGTLPYVVVYALVSLAYSMRLKEIQLVDVFILAALYTTRMFAGGEATGHEISLWLLAFSSFLFLGLGIMKRVAELKAIAARDVTRSARRGYRTDDIVVLQTFSVAAAFAACLVLALYIQSAQVALVYSTPAMLWGIIPLMLFWQCRMLLATARGAMDDDPIVYAAKDGGTVPVIAGIALFYLLSRWL